VRLRLGKPSQIWDDTEVIPPGFEGSCRVSGLAKLFDHNQAWGQVRERATEGWPEG
jgi:hypothetical protein